MCSQYCFGYTTLVYLEMKSTSLLHQDDHQKENFFKKKTTHTYMKIYAFPEQ